MTEASAEARGVDPLAAIIHAVRSVDPELPADVVTQALAETAATRARLRRLAQALESSGDLLVGAPPTGPIIVDQFISALRDRGARSVLAPTCPSCGKASPLVRWHDGVRRCEPCTARTERTACAGCGKSTVRLALNRAGRPVCRRCDQADRTDPAEIVCAAVGALDPGAKPTSVAAQLIRAVPNAAQRRKLAWALQDDPALLTGAGADGPPSLIALVDALLELGIRGVVRPACPLCGSIELALSNTRDGRRCCKPCYRRTAAAVCGRCDRVQTVAGRGPAGEALCAACYRADPVNYEACDACGRSRPVAQRLDGKPRCTKCRRLPIAKCTACGRTRPCTATTKGTPRCPACAERLREKEPCDACGNERRVGRRLADGRALCPSCAARREPCAVCGNPRRVAARDQHAAALCKKCYEKHPLSRDHCVRCGALDHLHHFGLCNRCAAHRMLCRLLGGDDESVAPQLKGVLDTLEASDPKGVLTWLRNREPRDALAALGAAGSASHEILDALPAVKSAQYLRSILVTGGVLPARNEAVAALLRWIPQGLAEVRRAEDRKVLDSYVRWHRLRRLRSRPEHQTTAEHTARIRDEINASVRLLNWLDQRGRTLKQTTQSDIDLWIAATPPKHHEARAFVAWAVERRHARGIEIPQRRITRSRSVISDAERLDIIRRLLEDTTLDTASRLAGLLVVVFAQPLNRVARLTLDQIHREEHQVKLAFGTQPVVIPPPIDQILLKQAERRHRRAVVARTGTSPWLFPGLRAGEPMSPQGMLKKLRHLGIQARPARHTALLDLAKDVPAPVLSRLLGISLWSATRWCGETGAEGAQYAAEVARRHTRPPVERLPGPAAEAE